MTAEVLLQGIVSGPLMGLVYALIAAGLSLIFGLMEIVNFAHGEFLMVAMFTSYWAWALWRLDPLVSLPLAVCLAFRPRRHDLLRSHPLDPRCADACPDLRHLRARGVPALGGPGGLGRGFSGGQEPAHGGPFSVAGLLLGLPQLVASAGSLAAFAGLHWFISRTETGLALQATAQDRQAASLMGIDTQRMFALGWGIGAACVGVAAALLSGRNVLEGPFRGPAPVHGGKAHLPRGLACCPHAMMVGSD
ncbi:MAG TPA: branched-chain amino acid ABC transporter permease [Candidatus Limnocylindria bacterium]|nr:branched-chain amino acid ABC transporter permease [Candidatus Limnocylindria bacterium]